MKINSIVRSNSNDTRLTFSQISKKEGIYRIANHSGHSETRLVVISNSRKEFSIIWIDKETMQTASENEGWDGYFFCEVDEKIDIVFR